jgi:transmembrane sensor
MRLIGRTGQEGAMTAKTEPRAGLQPIDASALSWFMAHQAGEADDEQFAAWRAVDPRHELAYARIERLWASPALAKAASRVRPLNRAHQTSAAVAVALCLFLATTAGLRVSGTQIAWPADHATAIGEVATTRLDDGTTILLDSGSAIDVTMVNDRREVRLLRGRAFVTVAADARPFRMLSGDAVIRDIGTRFAVARADEGEQVAVQEGIVELRESEDATARALLRAEQGSGTINGTQMPVRTLEPLEAFGWTQQRLYFSGRRLDQVVAELRRYYRGWIVIADQNAAAMRISGGLRLDDPDAAMTELARLSGRRVTRIAGRILILR